MRQSILLVPTETAPRVFAATRPPLAKLAGRPRYAGLDDAGYARLKDRVLEHTREPIAPTALQQAIEVDARVMTGVRIMAYEGLIRRLGGSLRTDTPRYVATEAWLGRPLEEPDPAESLRWLAGEYLRGHGPARVQDFAWWAGVTRRAATAALQGTDTAEVGGGLLLPADEAEAFESVEPIDPEAIDLLPKWDPYTMGHAPNGRQRLIEDEYLSLAYSSAGVGTGATSGDGLPLVLRGGHAIATWSHRFKGARMEVQFNTFDRTPSPRDSMSGRSSRLRGYWGPPRLNCRKPCSGSPSLK